MELKAGFLSTIKTPLLLVLFPYFYGCTTPLIHAIYKGNAQEVTKLLDAGADPNEKGLLPHIFTNTGGNGACNLFPCTIWPVIGLPGFGAIICPIILMAGTPLHTTPLTEAQYCQKDKNILKILRNHGANKESELFSGNGSRKPARIHKITSSQDTAPDQSPQSEAPPAEIGTGLDATSPPKASRHAFARKAVPNSSVDTPDYSERARPDDFALVVGVEKYAQDLPAAQFADRDAEAMRRHLLALGVPARHIVFLHDALATRSELVKNIERWLPKNVKPNSRVYFYFSGHGAPDPTTGQAYLVGFDGDPSDLADTAYPLSRLYAKLGKLKAHRVIIALDSCFSGAGGRSVLAPGARPLVNRIIEGSISPNGKIIALTASKSDQISGILEDKGHGAFTYYLLKGLNGKALDSQNHVTLESLYHYLKPKVEDAAHLDDRDQDPQLLPPKNPAERLTLR